MDNPTDSARLSKYISIDLLNIEGWLLDTPNPVEIAGAIDACRTQAAQQNLG